MRSPDTYCDAIYSTAYRERLCPDVVLKAFGKAYPSHRVILASQSAYFATLLRWVVWGTIGAAAPDQWPTLPCHELVLGEDVTQRGFEWILEYFYASPHVAITSDNAFDVLAAAHYLGVTAVQSACVEFLAQHLEPHNLAACLLWATRADHGEASEMLAASCCRLLALQLPSNLTAWAPALPHIEPRTLLDIMSADHLAVTTEHDRYVLVKEVANIICSAAAAAPPPPPDGTDSVVAGLEETCCTAVHGTSGEGVDNAGAAARAPHHSQARGVGVGVRGAARVGSGAGAAAAGALEVQRMLSSALRLTARGGEDLSRRMQLGRASSPPGLSCPEPLAPATADDAAAAAGTADDAPGGGGAAAASAARSRLRPWSSTDLRSRYASAAGELRCCADGAAAGLTCSGSPAASATELSTADSACADASSVLTSSQASSRSAFALFEPAGGGGGGGGGAWAGGGTAESVEGTGGPAGGAVANMTAMPVLQDGAAEDEGPASRTDSPVSVAAVAAAAAAAAAATARLLLHEAVRYEHLTVLQLMAVKCEGLVAADVLHEALWQRTRLDCEVHARGTNRPRGPSATHAGEHIAGPSKPQELGEGDKDGDGDGTLRGGAHAAAGSATAALLEALLGTANAEDGATTGQLRPLQQQQVGRALAREPGFRPFRVCWRLRCGALKKLAGKELLKSDLYEHAGALWQLRLCCSNEAGRTHLGLYVGRHLVTAAAVAAGRVAWGPGAPADGLASPARQQQQPEAAANPGADAGGGHAQQQRQQRHHHHHHHRQPRQRPPQQQQQPGPQQPREQPTAVPAPFLAFTDHSALLRGRCRVSVFQSDNTALQGRLCLADTGDFCADFAAGGYFGQGQLVARADLAQLRDEQEVLVFMVLHVLAG